MSSTPHPSEPAPAATLPHHRECVRCGYDLFGQTEQGVCPECGAPVAATLRVPLWNVTHPRRLARSRIGFRLIALSCAAYLLVVVAAVLLAALGIEGQVEVVAGVLGMVLVGGAAVASLTGLVLLGFGAGGSPWKRWLPLALMFVTVAWGTVDAASVLPPAYMWVATAVGFTLIWLFGVALQSLAAHVSAGVAKRVARVRSTRFVKVTRLLLLLPVLANWAILVALLARSGREEGWVLWGPMLMVIQCSGAIIVLWLLLAAIHWFRLTRLWKV